MVEWVNRYDAAAIIGCEPLGVMFLNRFNMIKQDCPSCGRLRWDAAELREHRSLLRRWLAENQPQFLLLDSESPSSPSVASP